MSASVWERGLDAMRSDDRLRRRALVANAMTTEQRLEEAAALAAAAARIVAQQPADVQDRLRACRESPPQGAYAALRRLLRGR